VIAGHAIVPVDFHSELQDQDLVNAIRIAQPEQVDLVLARVDYFGRLTNTVPPSHTAAVVQLVVGYRQTAGVDPARVPLTAQC